ncbi:MAG: immune inhibitor A [Bacteroidetes bacterium]|nr:immune inhibitor A [Bacteroidota bacterium]
MRYFLFLFLFSISLSLHAQQFSRVKISLDESHSMTQLAELGLDVDHGRFQPGKYFIGEFDASETEAIRAAGFATEVLVADLEAQRHELNAAGATTDRSLPPCDAGHVPTQYETPANYTDGTMGGYYKYQEMLDILDQMATLYPNIVKAKKPITTAYTTIEGRPVYWLKVSDNPNVDENEPEILYNAVHHAREPNSLSQMVFYLWYLLENYDTDPEVKYLVDNVEMYFVPCVNPDGYIYNETTNPNGGGMWRKNRRNNGDGTFGVDLNRNYGYQWGFDDTGSSTNTNAQTYRGTAPFSEPETQMMRDFCLAHNFQIALNYHTFSNLLIYPWGFIDGATPDHATFSTFGPWMTRDNNYLTGFGSQTVGYTTNGDSDDWMYGEMASKAKIISMTPEVGPGTYGFWPPQTAIDGLNKDGMTMNLSAAHLVLNFGLLTPGGDRFIANQQGSVLFSLKKMGLAPGLLTVSLEPLSDNIAAVGSPVNYGMFHLEESSGAIPFMLKPSIQQGDTVLFNLVLDNGIYQWKQPIERIYTSLAATAFLDTGDDLSNWSTNGDWALTSQHFHSAPTSLTDSPSADYEPGTFSDISMQLPVNVKDATNVYLSFWAKWNIEEDEDYAQVLGSFGGSSYQPLCGKYTETGTEEQSFDEPVYDGLQQNWVREEFDLSDWLALDDSVDFSFTFRMVSDEFIEADGFYFDDVELTVANKDLASSTIDLDLSNFKLTTRPNPARDFVIIDVESEKTVPGAMQLEVFNALGQMVKTQDVQGQIVRLDTGGWQAGVYQYRLSVNGKCLPAGRFMVAR